MLALRPSSSPPFSSFSPSPPHSAFHASHKRPRGLWKGRREPTPNLVLPPHAFSPASERPPLSRAASVLDDDDDDRYSSCSSSSKRRRCTGYFDSVIDLDLPSPFASSVSGSRTPPSDHHTNYAPVRPPIRRVATITSILNSMEALSSPKGKQPTTADYEDWQNLKELFARAVDRYDADDIPEALPLLRAVIRECHRFLNIHPDPSVVFADPPVWRNTRSPETMTPTDERLSRDWGSDFDSTMDFPEHRSPTPELPTAFHAMFGMALYHMGSLIQSDKRFALPGEPDEPYDWWLAALDVFETGENLPSRTGGLAATSTFSDIAEDWRMAIAWGRTLVSLADAKVAHTRALARQGAPVDEYCYLPNTSPFPMSEPNWPLDSPFAVIAAARPPVSRRMSLYSASAHEVMTLAMDQFSRGIFHMPHPHYPHSQNPHAYSPALPATPRRSFSPSPHLSARRMSTPPVGDTSASFSRPRELFNIATDVLGVAERLEDGTQRAYWAQWAESVLTQMKMEADMENWRASLAGARGRCWLVMGEAIVEQLEDALERGEGVLQSEEAKEAREDLVKAVDLFERAKDAEVKAGTDLVPLRRGERKSDVKELLAEALLSRANLEEDEERREALYARAARELCEAGSAVTLPSREEWEAQLRGEVDGDGDDKMDLS